MNVQERQYSKPKKRLQQNRKTESGEEHNSTKATEMKTDSEKKIKRTRRKKMKILKLKNFL